MGITSASSSAVKMALIYLCIIYFSVLGYCNSQSISSVATGIYSTKKESNGLYLAANNDFQPIGDLTIKLTLSKPAAFFIHYQVTVDSGTTNADFWTKLRVNYINAGALVHSGNQQYKTATGYWMGNLDPGYYTFQVYYKSPVSVSMSSSSEFHTAVVNVMWFENTKAHSDGVNCEFVLNEFHYNNNPVKDLEIELTTTAYYNYVLAAYQLSTFFQSSSHWSLARMHLNNEQISSTTMAKGDNYYVDLSSSWIKELRPGDYQFGVTYRNYGSNSNSYYEDCRNNYTNSQNLYVMVLPSTATCRIRNLEPSNSMYVSTTNTWLDTDLSYNIYLSRSSHVIIRYQFSTSGGNSYHITRLLISSKVQQHTTSITGSYSNYAGNSGLWQGVLSSGYHHATLQYKTGRNTYHHYPYSYSRSSSYIYYTRAMDIVYCY